MAGLLEFKRLSTSISLFNPTPASLRRTSEDPTIIIICQWMGAHPKSRTLSLINNQYHDLYPSARIVSIRSLPEFFMSTPTAARLKMSKPILEIVDTESEPKILVHLFSNGGSLSLADISHVWKKQKEEVLPVKAMILDSAPGSPGLREAWTAMAIGLPKGMFWYPAAAVLAVASLSFWVGKKLGLSNLVEETRKDLNDGSVIDLGAKRLYVYSEADRLVGWKDVERHASEARERGVEVVLWKAEGSAHVQHMGKPGDENWTRYWRLPIVAWGTR